MSFERVLDRYYKTIISKVNSSLPRIRIGLIDLLEMEEPFFETLDGSTSNISKDELNDLCKKLPKEVSITLKLPFIFLRNYKLGDGVYSIEGNRNEAEAFRRLMDLSYDLPKASDSRYFTYKPFVFEFMKRYKTICVVGFL